MSGHYEKDVAGKTALVDDTDDLIFTIRTKKFKRASNIAVDDRAILERLHCDNCLCHVPDDKLREWFFALVSNEFLSAAVATTATATTTTGIGDSDGLQTMRYLSVLQTIFDVCLKRNRKGKLCGKVYKISKLLLAPESQILAKLSKMGYKSCKYGRFLATKVISRFLLLASNEHSLDWLNRTLNELIDEHFRNKNYTLISMNFDILRRVLESKDFEEHKLEEDNNDDEDAFGVDGDASGPSRRYEEPESTTTIFSSSLSSSSSSSSSSQLVPQSRTGRCLAPISILFDAEDEDDNDSGVASTSQSNDERNCWSIDTSQIKCTIVKCLETRWQTTNLIPLVRQLLLNGQQSDVTLSFLYLWESIISIRANLSVIETKPFFTNLDQFVAILSARNTNALICRQLLSLFNEFLCYGSTLALQDTMPDETCSLAHLIVRHVKDYRLLDHLPWRLDNTDLTISNFAGPIAITDGNCHQEQITVDKCLLQKVVLLVLKSVAVVVRETRGDSSDSSDDSSVYSSDDQDTYTDMQVIERSIRDVLIKLDKFLKQSLEYHPQSHISNMIVHLFHDQDDYLIESMVCTLDTTLGLMRYGPVAGGPALGSNADSPATFLVDILNPVHTFIDFLKAVHHEPEVLLDYLISNETCFLLYLLRFLKFARRNWPSHFVTSCYLYAEQHTHSGPAELDRTVDVFVQLKSRIQRLVSKDLFPYNITPILRLLEYCQYLHESNNGN